MNYNDFQKWYDYNPFLLDYKRLNLIAIDFIDKKITRIIIHFDGLQSIIFVIL